MEITAISNPVMSIFVLFYWSSLRLMVFWSVMNCPAIIKGRLDSKLTSCCGTADGKKISGIFSKIRTTTVLAILWCGNYYYWPFSELDVESKKGAVFNTNQRKVYGWPTTGYCAIKIGDNFSNPFKKAALFFCCWPWTCQKIPLKSRWVFT